MAEKNIKLKDGEDIVYPQTKVGNILNDDGTKWEVPSGGFKKVVVNMQENTWDVSQVDITKDRNIILTDASGNSVGIANYSQINSNPTEFGYTLIIKMLFPYVANFDNSVEYNTFVLKLDGTIDMLYEGYYYYTNENSITFFNKNMISNEYNYEVTSLVVPTLPSDASSKTYTLKAVNGVLTWVE